MALHSSRAFAAAALVLAACGAPDPGPAPEPAAPPNVLLVVVDTLRRDFLAPYGYTRHPTSPRLAQLAAEGVVVDGLLATSPWTLPSMASLFTGLTPAEHRVARMRITDPDAILRDGRTLAAEFRGAGYATACVMSNFLMLRGKGFNEGFDRYDDAPARRPQPHQGSTAAEVAERGLAWLAAHDADEANAGAEQPWFLVLHFFDPHTSYVDHPQIHFTDPTYTGWVRGGLSDADYKAHQATATAADRAQLAALYAEEVRAVDDALGLVLDALEARGEADETLIVFTADHGEELAERGYIGHTRTLHFEQLDLPLVVRFPDGAAAGSRRQGLMPLREVYATLLDAAGLPVPTGRGPSRAAWLRDAAAAPAPTGPVHFEVDFEPVKPTAVPVDQRGVQARLGGDLLKYVVDDRTGVASLWSVAAGETTNLAGDPARAADLARLRSLLAAHRWYSP